MPSALITGITGQDGSYLAELLLEKGYAVHGLVRRSSSFNTGRIDNVLSRVKLHYGDLVDSSSLHAVLKAAQPDEIYNLGSQSHVRVSFEVPEYTCDVAAAGVGRLLEAVRVSGRRPKFYQAASSELYGKVEETPQTETTRFHPRSPYACSKAYAFYLTQNYREAYGLYCCNGILFNHECIAATTPIVIRRDGTTVDVVTPDELVPLVAKGRSVQHFEPSALEVWDGADWTAVRAITATRRRTTDPEHRILSVQARGGIADVTAHHHMLDADLVELPAIAVAEGQRLALAQRFPEQSGWTALSPELAEFLGLMTAEGHVPERHSLQFTNNDPELREKVASLWSRLFLGKSRTEFHPSGFDPARTVGQLYLTGGNSLCEWLRSQLYTPTGYKRVPSLVLNATPELQRIFLDGYYLGDGLKAGGGDSVKTDSAVLAQGLCWLYGSLGRLSSIYVEHRGDKSYYQLNLATATPLGEKGQHLRKDASEVRRVADAPSPSEWVFDLATESGRFCAGVGRLVVHNSPRRGENFVTRKITRAVGRIVAGTQQRLGLGNLDAKRDWGFAGDYVVAMWQMLQLDEPEDFVVATGETHSVRDFLDRAFGRAKLDWKKYVDLDPRQIRPSEVELLLGDPSKAKKRFGWEPKVKFDALVDMMVDADLELAKRESAFAKI